MSHKPERPCTYCGELTTNWFAACCDKAECRAKMIESQRERRSAEKKVTLKNHYSSTT